MIGSMSMTYDEAKTWMREEFEPTRPVPLDVWQAYEDETPPETPAEG